MGSYSHNRRMELYHELPIVINHALKCLPKPCRKFLDVGCWDGEFTSAYAKTLGSSKDEAFGIDCFPALLEVAKQRGIRCQSHDLEIQGFPFEEAEFDVVICNQVMEHLKQIYLPISEIHRVLKPGGYAVISVPNLAALHNRLLLLMGRQPTTIRVMGPHVRGFTLGAFTEFLTLGDLFRCIKVEPVGMFPFPIKIGSGIGKLFPSLCHTPVWVLQKTDVQAPNWLERMKDQKEQTNFFGDDRKGQKFEQNEVSVEAN
jgi:SAM-dependent methyltransferase